MTILLADPRVAAVPVRDNGEPLVRLPRRLSPTRAPVRADLAVRLDAAAAALPDGVGLRVAEGHRSAADQLGIAAAYTDSLRRLHPDAGAREIALLSSRFVAPLAVAPHVAGAAVDLTLVDERGVDLDLGTPIDATPEQSAGRCFTAAPDLSASVRENRRVMAVALGGAGLVNYPTEWWHWSFGDRYWALVTGAGHARYGAVPTAAAA